VTRDMQSTNRYEPRWVARCARFGRTGSHDGLASTPATRTPISGDPLKGALHGEPLGPPTLLESFARHGDPDSTTTCGVSVKTSSETENVATRPLDPGEEIDLTEEHPSEPYPIRNSGVTPLALPRTRSPAHRRLERAPGPPVFSSLCREERPVRRTLLWRGDGARSLLSSRLPREH